MRGISSALVLAACANQAASPATAPVAAESTDRRVENLLAFATLYGEVRFFHPSDEAAAADWQVLALEGASRVVSAQDDEALRDALLAVFGPVAPTAQIWIGAPPEAPRVPTIDGGAVVAWQHVGFGESPSSVYRSKRTGRGLLVAASDSSFGNAMQSLPAEALAGKRIRLRAAVRAQIADRRSYGGLWLRVDRANGDTGFFDNMSDRPITSDEWVRAEIVGEVAKDAVSVNLGALFVGSGSMWVDSVTLEVDIASKWVAFPLVNGGFEDGRLAPWLAATPGYAFEQVDDRPHEGEKCLKIAAQSITIAGDLFVGHARRGDASVRRLTSSGLSSRVPLALVLQPEAQPRSQPASIRQLPDVAKEIESAAALIIAWNVFRHFYPYTDVVAIDWDRVLADALAKALDGADPETSLNELVAVIDDGHGRVVGAGRDRGFLPWQLAAAEGEVVVLECASPELVAGDVVRSIDGVAVNDLLAEAMRRRSGSERWRRSIALEWLGVGGDGDRASVTVRRGGSDRTVMLARGARFESNALLPPISDAGDGVLVVDLNRATRDEVREALAALASARGVVFDLRVYPNSNHFVLNHLLSTPDDANWMFIPQFSRPDQAGATFAAMGWALQPAQPHIGGKVAFLISGRAISYAESVLGLVEHYRLGALVGEASAGANGNVASFEVPGGFQIYFTAMRVLKPDGRQHHLLGIEPTLPVSRTIEGIRAGRDEVLEAGIAAVR